MIFNFRKRSSKKEFDQNTNISFTNSTLHNDKKINEWTLHNQKCAIDKISKRIDETGFATENLITIINDIAKNIEMQMESINKVMNEVVNYSALSEEVFANISSTEQIAEETLKVAEKGSSVVDESIKSMNDIKGAFDHVKDLVQSLQTQSSQITNMLDIIKNIARQTNLLALNAAIEAARAGEHGKGFAVVADEVRKLAQTSDKSVDKIALVIEEINENINKTMNAIEGSEEKVNIGVEISNNTIETFNQIIESVKLSTSATQEINVAVSEQVNHLEDIIQSTNEMQEISKKVLSLIELASLDTKHTHSAIEILLETSNHLNSITNNLLSKFNNINKNKYTLKTVIRTNLDSLDPMMLFDAESSRLFINIHAGLLIQGHSTDVLPGVAKSWYVEEDHVTWVFNLRKGAKFHNGREIIADDVKYSLERLLSPKLNSPNHWFLMPIDGAEEYHKGLTKDVKGIKVLDKYRLSITLKEPYSGFLLNLAQTASSILAKEDVEKNIFTGCGPYKIEVIDDEKYILNAFDDYFGGTPYISKIELIHNDESPMDSFIDGKYDFLIFSNNDSISNVQGTKYEDNIKTQNVLTTYYGCFNLNSNSLFTKDKEIRQAINYAINKKRIINDIIDGLAEESRGVFPPAIINDETLEGYPYNPNKARNILKRKGLINEKFVILCRENNSGIKNNNDKIVDYIIEDLKAIGIDSTIIYVHPKEYMKPENIAKCDMFIMGWVADTGDPDNYLEPLFNPDIYTNFGKYVNHEISNMMSEAKKIVNPEKRTQIYKKIQKIIVDDAPWLFLYHPQMALVHKENIVNVKLTSLGKIKFEDIIIKSEN